MVDRLIELDHVSVGKWITTDGAFGVVKKFKPINPMETSELPGKMDRHVFSVRDLREFDLVGRHYELAPEIYQARRFKDIVPWISDFVLQQKKDKLSEGECVDKDFVRNIQKWFDNWLDRWKRIPEKDALLYMDEMITEAVKLVQKFDECLRFENALDNDLRWYLKMIGSRFTNGEITFDKMIKLMCQKSKSLIKEFIEKLLDVETEDKKSITDYGLDTRLENILSMRKNVIG